MTVLVLGLTSDVVQIFLLEELSRAFFHLTPNPDCILYDALYMAQRFVTISARRATVWDGKTGEALTTLPSKRLLGNEEADITAFCLDHQVC